MKFFDPKELFIDFSQRRYFKFKSTYSIINEIFDYLP